MHCTYFSKIFAQRAITIFPRLLTCRHVHQKTTDKVDRVADGSAFITIYRCEKIMVCSMLNKLKKYQLGLVGAGTPTVFLMEALGLVDEATVQAFAGFGIASTVALFSICQLFTNLVGFVYLAKDSSRLKFSYLNFWGDRIDKIVPLEDVVGITPKSSLAPWDRLDIANDKVAYKITIQHGEVLHTPLFRMALKHDPDGVGD
ncbi:Transmembrane protein 186 [Nesidiocoris tenuis]|uniref:Transmembrane protein 186 n=1 Tax=Nesidiocoris tenuis TaxID=355587 RepID=A0ABN7BCE1_9HEMI|nr:Transmembrane protein 186 [Nesidiocoris tenuis]